MRTITIILLLFFSLLLEQSCNLKKDKISEISGSQFKLWELKKGSPVNSRATYYYYFTHKGGFKICEKFYQSKKIEEYSGSDVYYQRTWELKNDSTINIAGIDYHIVKLSYDTIRICNNNVKEVEMIRSDEKL